MSRAVPSLSFSLAVLLAAAPEAAAQSAIAYVSETHGTATMNPATSRASFNKVVAAMGANRYLVVALALPNTTASITAVSYAGAPLPLLGMQAAGDSCRIHLYGLADPATGVQREVAMMLSGMSGQVAWAAFDFTGVDQDRPTGNYSSRSAGTGQPTITIDHADGTWLVVHACRVDAGGVIQADYAVTRASGFGFTGAAGPWAIGGIPLLPAAGDGGATPDAIEPLDLAPVPPPDGAAGLADLPPAPPGDDPDASIGHQEVALQVGCACRAGGAAEPRAWPVLLPAAWLAIRRGKRSRHSVRQESTSRANQE